MNSRQRRKEFRRFIRTCENTLTQTQSLMLLEMLPHITTRAAKIKVVKEAIRVEAKINNSTKDTQNGIT
jgi:hypothetical protein